MLFRVIIVAAVLFVGSAATDTFSRQASAQADQIIFADSLIWD